MKKPIYFTLVAAIICCAPLPARAETPAPPTTVFITEIQAGGASTATEEFVEIYNPSDEPVDITGWLLQYRAASGTAAQAWAASTTKATIVCATGSAPDCTVVINPNTRLVLVHGIANIMGSLPMSGGFSGTGGQIRLVQPSTTPVVHDLVGYGTAAHFETAAATAPSSGKSIKRIVSTEGEPQDTNNNADDFLADCGNPSPGQNDADPLPLAEGCVDQTEPPIETPPVVPPVEEPVEPPEEPVVSYLPIQITEVFPDPVTPQQDSLHEFIELYNPHDVAISLAGYQIQTGGDYRYHYILGDTPLGPHSYLVITSAVSKLSLTNGGSGVRLIDPSGIVVAEAPNYGDAKAGQSWMLDGADWKWSLSPTPSLANILSLPLPPAPKPTVTAPTKKKAATTPKVAAAPKAPKAPAAPKTTTPVAAKTVANTTPPQDPPYWIILPLSLCIIGYAAYEYRQNIARAWQKMRLSWANRKNKQAKEAE